MLTIAKLGVGQEGYYLSRVASGLEDYYSGAGEIDGTWRGTGAERLGLDGSVDGKTLRALMDGVHPATGERLAGGQKLLHLAREPWPPEAAATDHHAIGTGLG